MSLIACSDSSMSLSEEAFLLKVRFLISRGVNRDVSAPRWGSLFSFCIVRDLVLVTKFDGLGYFTAKLCSLDWYEAASSFWLKSSKLVTRMSLNELITFNCGFSLIFISLSFSSSSIWAFRIFTIASYFKIRGSILTMSVPIDSKSFFKKLFVSF